MTEPLLTPDEVAGLVKLEAEVVRRAIRDGELRASKLRGRLRVRSADVDAWVDSCIIDTQAAEQPAEPSRRALPAHQQTSSLRHLMEQHLPAA